MSADITTYIKKIRKFCGWAALVGFLVGTGMLIKSSTADQANTMAEVAIPFGLLLGGFVAYSDISKKLKN